MSELLKKFNKIMNGYRKGLYGKENLSMSEILLRAKEPNLFEEMSIDELQLLCEKSSGFTKQMVIQFIRKKAKEQGVISDEEINSVNSSFDTYFAH